MLVTNFVIVPFWIGDVIGREVWHLEQLLVTAIATNGHKQVHAVPPAVDSYLAHFPGSCAQWGRVYFDDVQSGLCLNGLASRIMAMQNDDAVRTAPVAVSLADFFNNEFLYMVRQSQAGESVGIGIPLARLVHPLWVKERAIMVYLVFNASILIVLAVFRLLKTYVLPVDKVVQAAESYRSDGLHSFIEEVPNDRLGHLANSIQAMVRRIEEDKAKLSIAVQELAEKNRLLQENQRAMVRAEKLASVGRLAAGLAHEIGNPLGVAQGYLQLLGIANCTGQEREEYIGKALCELERMDALLRRLLDYARAEHGVPTLFDVHDMLREIVADFKSQPFLRGIRLDFLPQSEHGTVNANSEQLRQVILNCVLNAADSIKNSGKQFEGSISIGTAKRAQTEDGHCWLRIIIDDNGGGIPEHLLDAVFDPFFTTKEPGAGTGLGLSVSLTLIESMGGRMELRSKNGEGATVQITLPCARENYLENTKVVDNEPSKI